MWLIKPATYKHYTFIFLSRDPFSSEVCLLTGSSIIQNCAILFVKGVDVMLCAIVIPSLSLSLFGWWMSYW